MRSTLTRLLAGTAVAAAVVVTVAGTAGATTTPPKAPTTLSITLGKNTITAGQSDSISGTLDSKGSAVPGRIVELEKWLPKPKKWAGLVEKKTGAKGGVEFWVTPASTTSYRLVFNGTPKYAYTHSAVGTVRVKPFVKIATQLSIAESATAPIAPGSSDTISGQLTTTHGRDLGGQWVWLANVVNGKAHLLKAYKTGKYGKVSFIVKPKSTTTYELEFLGTPVYHSTVSGTVTATVS
jgi:hypothetical protein